MTQFDLREQNPISFYLKDRDNGKNTTQDAGRYYTLPHALSLGFLSLNYCSYGSHTQRCLLGHELRALNAKCMPSIT